MRSIWKGTVSFGLVTIPVKLYSATEERDVAFHQVRRSDGSRIKYKRVAAADGEEVPVRRDRQGLRAAHRRDRRAHRRGLRRPAADHPEDGRRPAVRAAGGGRPDLLLHGRTTSSRTRPALKPYVLLREALDESGRVAIVKVALRQRESLACLRVRDGVLVLETMLWPDEIREADFSVLDEEVEVKPAEVKMAQSLIEALSGDFDPDPVQRRVPGRARDAHRGQGRGARGGGAGRRRGGQRRRGRPDGRPARQRRGGEEGPQGRGGRGRGRVSCGCSRVAAQSVRDALGAFPTPVEGMPVCGSSRPPHPWDTPAMTLGGLGGDRAAVVTALRAVSGVADAEILPDPDGGPGTLRLQLKPGADEVSVAKTVQPAARRAVRSGGRLRPRAGRRGGTPAPAGRRSSSRRPGRTAAPPPPRPAVVRPEPQLRRVPPLAGPSVAVAAPPEPEPGVLVIPDASTDTSADAPAPAIAVGRPSRHWARHGRRPRPGAGDRSRPRPHPAADPPACSWCPPTRA